MKVFLAQFVVATLAISLSVQAAEPKKQTDATYLKKLNIMAPVDPAAPTFAIQTPEIQKSIEKSEKARTPAQLGTLSEAQMSPKLREIRDNYFSVQNSDELAKMLAKLDADYDSLPSDAKFFAAQIIPAQAFRGFVYRSRQVFEKRARGVHSAVLTMAKNTATNLRIYLPFEHMTAVEEYFMAPYFDKGQVVESFTDEASIQAFLTKTVKDQIVKAEKRLGDLSLVEPVIWDQRFSFGPKSFADGLNRFRLIGELEKTLVRSAMMSSVASLNFLRAYNINGSIDLARDLGSLYGIDGFLSVVDGVSAEKISKLINKYPKIGTILPEGKEAMKASLQASQWAVTHAWMAWKSSSESRKNESLYAIDSGYWRVNRRDIEQNLELLYRVVASNKSEKLRSSVTGEVIEINYAEFFNNPPADLKVFLPKTFEQKATATRQAALDITSTNDSKKPLSYRNYAQGTPLTWNVNNYTTYVPSVKTSADVETTVRVLSHAGGNWINILR